MNDSFRDTLYTINKKGQRKWLYPKLIKGKFFYRRACVAYFLLVFYLILPWITVGGKQAVLLNIAERQFTFFGLTLWATDTIFLTIALLGLAIALFFFTSLFGRIWCGWACPETVFLEFVFRPIERIIEGGPVQRKRLNEQKWNLEKIKKKSLMHIVRAVLAWIIASTALAYFIGREPLLSMMTQSPMENLDLFITTFILMSVMAFQFGWFREQFCTVLCPYARFQSVLLDRNTLTIGYDVTRGEPRGKVKKGKEEENATKGDCVDCGLCVKVCPTGIDIRNGSQLECINCAACIDACNSIMENMGRPLNLIRYDSEASLVDHEEKKLGVRPFIYGGILIIVSCVFAYVLLNREVTDFQVLRGALDKPFSIINEETVNNHLHVRITNKSQTEQKYMLTVKQEDVQAITPINPVVVEKGKIATAPLFITFSKSTLINGKRKVDVLVKGEGGFSRSQVITLLGPNG